MSALAAPVVRQSQHGAKPTTDDRLISLLQEWRRLYDSILPHVSDEEMQKTLDRCGDLEREMEKLPAFTMAGLAAKFEIYSYHAHFDEHGGPVNGREMGLSIRADTSRAMAEAHS